MDNAAETTATRVQQAAATAATAISQYINRSVAGTGPTLLQAPLFKAGKPLTKYATISDTPSTETVEFKEVLVTAHHTHKVIVKVSQPTKEKIEQHKEKNSALAVPTASGLDAEDDAEHRLKTLENAPPPPQPVFDIRTEWTNSLASIVSVDPLFDTTSNEDAPAAVFSVVFLCPTKDAKNLEDDNKTIEENKANINKSTNSNNNDQTGEILANMTKKRSALEWTLLALRHSSEVPLCAAEADHLKHVFKLGKPSLRCRAYLVPSILGGAAQRDEWVSVYRAAIQNYWQERLESSIISSPEVFQYCSWAQFGGSSNVGPGSPIQPDLPSSSICLVAISTKKLYIVNAAEAHLLGPENGRVPTGATRSADVSSVSMVHAPVATTPHVVGVECGKRPFAQFQFLCGQHAADFVLELQRVFVMLKGEDAEFPVVKD